MLVPAAAILITLILSAIPIKIAGGELWPSYTSLFMGALGTRYNFLETCVKASPLILTGLAVAFAFRAKFWNIGAEGQLMAGAIMAAFVGINFQSVPRAALLPLVIVTGFIAGGAWAAVPAFMKMRLNVDDVVSTLLLNYVMLNGMGFLLFGPMQQAGSSWPRSPAIAEAAQYPILLAKSRFHLGILIAAAAVFAVWFINSRTVFGYQSRVVGVNSRASFFGGIDNTKVIFATALISGGLAGLAGVGEVCAIHYHLLMDISPGFGYSGITIAMLGRLHPLGTALAAFFFSVIIVGAQSMSRITGVPTYIADVIQGMALLIMLVALLLTEYRVKVVKS
jgi:simple sugar transport system permease protein